MSSSRLLTVLQLKRLARASRECLRGVLGALLGTRSQVDLVYYEDPDQSPLDSVVEVRLGGMATARCTPDQAIDWCKAQTAADVHVVLFGSDAREVWRVSQDGPCRANNEPAPFFAAPGYLPEVSATHVESAILILASEAIDAVAIKQAPPPWQHPLSFTSFVEGEARPYSVFRSSSFDFDAKRDLIAATPRARLAKALDCRGIARPPSSQETSHRSCYLTKKPRKSALRIAVSDASRLRTLRSTERSSRPISRVVEDTKQPLLVLTSFLARGGAEHTLFETLRVLLDRFAPVIVTLAPHRAELGDRRSEFSKLSPRLYALGDWVHPAVMVGIISSLIEGLGIQNLYNANGTTLFYEFAPQLRARFPRLRIVDHLYDHRVGYIDQYRNIDLLQSIDACIAENHHIAKVLHARGWTEQRAPVIWPCGRRDGVFPRAPKRASIRSRIRGELGISNDAVVFLTAARTHAQKRPLDLVRLARRLRDVEVAHFVWAGGGELDDSFDEAIEASEARIRRLPFRNDIPDLIIASDVGCLVSEYEGLPVFMIECLQGGLPFIGTDVGEMGEVLRRTGAGLIVDRPGNIDALELATRRLLERAIRRELSANAAVAGSEFGVEACAERYAAAWRGRS